MAFDRPDIAMNKLIVTGLDSKFSVFDMRTYNAKTGYASVEEKVRFTLPHLVIVSAHPSFLAYLCVYRVDIVRAPCLAKMLTFSTGRVLEGLTACQQSHKSTIWMGAPSPHDRDVFMTGGGNGSLNLWKYSYPKARVAEDEEGQKVGVAGSLKLLNNAVISTQPIGSFDWSSDMVSIALLLLPLCMLLTLPLL